jgi:hypothetical protein
VSVELAQETDFSFCAKPQDVAHGELLGRLYESPPSRTVQALV